MTDSEFYIYMVDVAERLEVLANFLSCSVQLSSMARYNEPYKIKFMIDSIIRDELLAMSGGIIDDINENN